MAAKREQSLTFTAGDRPDTEPDNPECSGKDMLASLLGMGQPQLRDRQIDDLIIEIDLHALVVGEALPDGENGTVTIGKIGRPVPGAMTHIGGNAAEPTSGAQ